MRRLLVVLLLLAGCKDPQDSILLRQAHVTYLNVELGKMSDSSGQAYFRGLTEERAGRLHDLLTDELRQLELDYTKPEKHYDAECKHSYDICQIKMKIETCTGTLNLMGKARSN